MLLKMMGPEPVSDDDTRKTFYLLDNVAAVNFRRDEYGVAAAEVVFGDNEAESYELTGNAYLMNITGKVIASFGCSPIPETPPTFAELKRHVEELGLLHGRAA